MLQSHAGEVLSEGLLPPLWSPPEPSLFRGKKYHIHRMQHKKNTKTLRMELRGGEMGEDLKNYPVSSFHMKDQLEP